jgi:hypothetical protein
MLRVDSHAWAASSAGAYWNTTEKMDEKVEIVNYNKWVAIVIQRIVRKKKGLRDERTHTALNSPWTEPTLTIIYIGHFWQPL